MADRAELRRHAALKDAPLVSALRMGAAIPSVTIDTVARLVAFLDNAVHPDSLTSGIGDQEKATAREFLKLICKAYRESAAIRGDRKAVRA